MNKESELIESKEKSKRLLGFHERFDIEVNLDTAKERFINRIFNLIDDVFSWLDKSGQRGDTEHGNMRFLARNLGLRYNEGDCLSNYVHGDYFECLRCIEALYQVFEIFDDAEGKENLTFLVSDTLSMSEVDLGIEWKSGFFSKSGAKLLDVALVNENLEWLSEPKYANVRAPFEKGLRHFVEVQKQPEKLMNVITDIDPLP